MNRVFLLIAAAVIAAAAGFGALMLNGGGTDRSKPTATTQHKAPPSRQALPRVDPVEEEAIKSLQLR